VQPASEHVPVQVEDHLSAALADVDGNLVPVETRDARRLCDELEHPLRLVRRELADVVEGRDVPPRQDEQVRVRGRLDVPDGDEVRCGVDVVAVADEPAEEAVVGAPRQRGSPPA
jgi:hypothetical protein